MYVATTISENYIFQGFGTTEAEAKDALINEINEFLGENYTLEEIASDRNFMQIEIQKVTLGHGITSVRY